jgi:hypothetical protein
LVEIDDKMSNFYKILHNPTSQPWLTHLCSRDGRWMRRHQSFAELLQNIAGYVGSPMNLTSGFGQDQDAFAGALSRGAT